MKKPLLEVIFASNKRKNVLLLLRNGTQKMEVLLKALDTTRQALLPQMKVLEEHHLVNHYKDTYELTTLGKLIVANMDPLVDTLDTLDIEIDYWGTHNLDFIPPPLLERICEVQNCKIITPSLTNHFEPSEEILEKSLVSKAHHTISAVYHPNFLKLFTKMIQNNVHVYFVITTDVLDKIKSNDHAYLIKLIKHDLFNLYVYSHIMNLFVFV